MGRRAVDKAAAKPAVKAKATRHLFRLFEETFSKIRSNDQVLDSLESNVSPSPPLAVGDGNEKSVSI